MEQWIKNSYQIMFRTFKELNSGYFVTNKGMEQWIKNSYRIMYRTFKELNSGYFVTT